MSSTIASRPTDGGNGDRSPVARDDVFYELLLTLAEESDIALDANAIREFRSIIDSTIGDYLAAADRQLGQDLWQDEKFRQFASVNTRKIARAARTNGGERPSAADVRQAANDVIPTAHDKYCASLPNSRPKNMAAPLGPVCAMYLQKLREAPGPT